jgi:hypothetical protein
MQRAKRHDGQSELLRGWGELVFGAVDEVVLNLGAPFLAAPDRRKP